MADAKRDANRTTTLIAPSTVDGSTPLNVGAIPIANVNPLAVAVVDGSGTQVTTFTISPATTLADGRTVVTTAGTRVALAASTSCKWVIITSETDNTGVIVVGAAATVVASLATRRGTPLYPGESVVIAIDNLADIGLDSTVSTDGVTYQYGA